jgi:hypothetical protein
MKYKTNPIFGVVRSHGRYFLNKNNLKKET